MPADPARQPDTGATGWRPDLSLLPDRPLASHGRFCRLGLGAPILRCCAIKRTARVLARFNAGDAQMSGVLVLNTDDTALHTVSINHAIGMLVRRVAVVAEATPGESFGCFPLPTTLRLTRYVTTRFLYLEQPGWTRRGVLRRDGWRCAYCSGHAATVDHVLPRSRGGANAWLNTVACCQRCNTRKADLTPDEAGMPLRWQPFIPSRRQLLSAAGFGAGKHVDR